MKSLNEIGGTSISDLFTILPAEANSNPADNLMAEDIPIHEDLNLGTIVDCDIAKSSMTWPFYEVNNAGQDTYQDIGMINEALLNPDDALFSYSIQQTSLSNHDVGICSYWGAANEENCYPWSPYWTMPLQRELQNRLPITLVLDLDGMTQQIL